MKLLFLFLFALLILPLAFLNAQDRGSSMELLPDTLYDVSNRVVSKTTLDGKIIGLYFSANWCPPCRAFTPKLIDFRNRFQDEFEVVLINFDRDSAAQSKYMAKYQMPWLVTEHRSQEAQALQQRFRVAGIPTLIIIGPDGQTLSTQGYREVRRYPKAALEQWKSRL